MNDEVNSIDDYKQQLLDYINNCVHCDGIVQGLRPGLRSAFLKCPRHLFVERYLFHDTNDLNIGEGDRETHFARIYSDVVLGHIDPHGQPLPSTNSQPSFVLRLLELLDLQSGLKVLEIGSGSGWLLGIIAATVGPQGRAVGIEIIPSLADQSRRSLAAAGIENAEVVTADGANGWPEMAPFDRIIFTAGLQTLPRAFFDQVAAGGLLLAPFQIKNYGDDVLLLRRMEQRRSFSVEMALPACFVRFAGTAATEPDTPSLEELPLWKRVKNSEVLRLPLSFGGRWAETFQMRTMAFRSFLTRIEPRLMAFGGDIPAFGIVDEAEFPSLAICRPNEMVGYGHPRAAFDLLAAYQKWTDLFMPGAEVFESELIPLSELCHVSPAHWVEIRGETAFVHSIKATWPQASKVIQSGFSATQ